jgi:hypothetical protein
MNTRLAGWFAILCLTVAAAIAATEMTVIEPADARPRPALPHRESGAIAKPDTTAESPWASHRRDGAARD